MPLRLEKLEERLADLGCRNWLSYDGMFTMCGFGFSPLRVVAMFSKAASVASVSSPSSALIRHPFTQHFEDGRGVKPAADQPPHDARGLFVAVGCSIRFRSM